MQTQTVSAASQNKVSTLSARASQGLQALDELREAFDTVRRIARQQYLYRAGEPCSGIYLIEEGSVKVSTLSSNGDEQIVRFYLPGEILALEALGESRHSSSAMALEPTRVRMLSLPTLEALSDRSPGLYRRLLHLVSRRIAELQEHMLMLGRKTAPERLAGFLTDLTLRTRTRELTLTMSRDAIGSYLGIALETVSRLLHQFDDAKLICLQGRHVAVMEPNRLRRLAEGDCARAAA
jgi:CRP/FNR family transcriptional regulator, anaerobic regulatory protein